MATLDSEFKRAIADYLERFGTSRKKLGEFALDEPGFVADLNRGHSPRLDAVDWFLRFMGASPIGPRFRRGVEVFLIVARVRTNRWVQCRIREKPCMPESFRPCETAHSGKRTPRTGPPAVQMHQPTCFMSRPRVIHDGGNLAERTAVVGRGNSAEARVLG